MRKHGNDNVFRESDPFEALFNFASIGILVANQEGIIQMANACLVSQFGYAESKELIGKEIEVLIPHRFSTSHHSHRHHYVNQPERRPMGVGRDLFGLKKDGTEFPVEVSLSHYYVDAQLFVIAFLIDITRRKEIEKAVLQQKEQLTAKNQEIEDLNASLEQKVVLRTRQLQEAMEELKLSKEELSKALSKEKELGDLKSRFVSMASHEFKTPLSTILSSASLLAKYTESSEQEKRNKHIDRIKSSVNNLTDILNEFLSIGKMEDGKIKVRLNPVILPEFLSGILNDIKPLAKPQQQISYRHEGDDHVQADASLLRNIVFNLLSNAIKFSGENGRIEVLSKVTPREFSIEVSDDGIGIAKEEQVHLFERFFRASNVTNIQGTGLGLHIVARYAELLGGAVSLESELEKGTAIRITLKMLPQS